MTDQPKPTAESAVSAETAEPDLAERQRAHRQEVLDRIEARQAEAERVRDAKRAQAVRQTTAVAAFAVKCTQMGPGQPWESFQCDEIEALADLLRAFDLGAVADHIVGQHADADDNEDDWHHDQWVPIIGSQEEATDAA